MGRALMTLLALLLAAGCVARTTETASGTDPLGPYHSSAALVEAVECGQAGPDDFLRAIRRGPVRLEEVSPPAVANYLEALAYDGMLDRVPAGYTDSEAMILSYETVFEDARNVFNNWEAYKAFLRRVYRADLG